ncbi:MAG: response regulator [Acidobacteria bacterium]|nr:response regulator [Acidobacteriota bacterium]
MPTVLVIEDDPDMQAIERTMLECVGYTVKMAGNGAEGLQSLKCGTPCLILLDLMMPIMDGLSFLRERKRLAAAQSTPVICVSAAGPELVGEALRLGAVECLHKPTDFDELCHIVARYCPGSPPQPAT